MRFFRSGGRKKVPKIPNPKNWTPTFFEPNFKAAFGKGSNEEVEGES